MPEDKRYNDEDRILENRVIKEDALMRPLERKNRRRAIAYTVMVLAAAAAFFAVVFTVFFKISEISVSGDTHYGEAELVSAAGIETGTPLFGFDAGNVETRILNELPYVKEVSVSRKIPSTVGIEITEERAAFAFRVANDDYIVSDTFKVLERVPAGKAPQELVKVTTGPVDVCIVGGEISFAETRLLDSLKTFWNTLCAYGQEKSVDYIEAYDRFDIYFGYQGRIRVFLGDARESDAKIRFFVKIMEHIYEDQSGTLDISDKKEATFSPYDSN